ncbi:M56 family metallopeptidase [Paenibacillus eucommiae]|uniref:Beta-lactamase regulating signal transducer with metallopeptidase domain n=1 Tax=Paenibacillus eucommiae TaxID=1355755 RepID=A0ABS4J9S0_9BACL|nr:M56 family metallopeptidase [Paenibacillus eucommiae]MBP1996597.1 beta-lactamase regulating signal transducer with metallopeptidase domain [Paenibacillus eucommiae]
MWERRSRILIISNLFIAMCILLQMGMYVTQGLLGRPYAYNIFDHCISLLNRLGLSWMVYLLDTLVVYTLIMMLWVIGKQLYFSRRTYTKLNKLVDVELTAAFNQMYGEGRKEFIVVTHPDSIALTMRFIRPQIVLSTGLLELLHEDELEALIQHERFHRKNNDPLKTFLMFLSSSVLWYVPILKWSYKQYQTAREVLADCYAIGITGSSESLGSALLKLLSINKKTRYSFTYASFAESSINYRIQYLIDPQTKLAFRLPVQRMIISLQVVVVLSAMFFVELI